ncbi:hypothetical protein [Pseudomonas atacamensis]|uniref:hypothetical protein n=1 Tax=Pseudomonas atacamensis TaxID=2565368 RepID=UPI0038577856
MRRFESMEINLVGIEAGQPFVGQQFDRKLPGRIEQTWAVLHNGSGDGFEGGFVRCVWQQTTFGSGHAGVHP